MTISLEILNLQLNKSASLAIAVLGEWGSGGGGGGHFRGSAVLNPDCLLVSCVFAMVIERTSSYGIFEPLFRFGVYIYLTKSVKTSVFKLSFPLLTEYRNCLNYVFSKKILHTVS